MAGPWEDYAQPKGPWSDFSPPSQLAPSARQAKDISDAVIAGLQSSATGLAVRGKLPSMQLGEDAPWHQRLASSAANLVADIPLSIAGAVGGAAAGSAVAPVAGTIVGGGAGAFAAPMALRDALMTAYNNNHAASWDGVMDIAWSAIKGGAKGAVIGGLTGGAGLAAKGAMGIGEKTVMSLGQSTKVAGSELAALTAASAVVEQHMPTWQDFMDNAILLGGMKGAVAVAKNMRGVYAETGKTPDVVLGEAAADPKIAEQLKAGMPEAYQPLALEERIKSAIDADPRADQIRKLMTEKDGVKVDVSALESDPVKYEYITDKETAAGVLRAVSEMYEKEMATQTRGVVSNKQSALEGLKLISDGNIGEHLVGDAANSGEIWARAHMLKGAVNHAVSELEKLSGIPEADLSPAMKLTALASLERVSMLKAEIEGVGAEAGRALQIFRTIKRDPSFLGEADTLLKLAERKGSLQDIAALVARLKDPAQVAKFAREYTKATTTEKVLEAWKAAILSGPQTHIANVFGNATKWFVELPENMISATLTALDRAAKGDPLTMAQWKARAFSQVYGLQHGAREALTVAAEVAKGSGDHLEKGDVYRTAIEGKTGEVIRLPFKALQVEDALFRTVAERAEAYVMATDRAVKEGWHPSSREFTEAVTKYTADPALGLSAKDGAAALAHVQQIGAEGVFSQRLGPRMEAIQRAMAGHWTQFIVPFFRTPANLVSWTVQHTPVLNLMSGRWREAFAAGGEQRSKAIARVVVGTGLAAGAYSMAQDDMLTGGGFFDKEQRGTKNAAGWQPYSIKIGDKYYSYQRIEPVAKVLGLAADLVELEKNTKDEHDRAKIAGMLVLMFGNATVSTTYLSGISNSMNAVTDPERYGGNFIEQYASSLVPKLLGQSAAAIDPHKREVDGALDAIQSQIPFLREKLLPKRDVWGEPAKNDRLFAVMPVTVTEESKDKVRTEAARLAVAIADAPKYVYEKGPFKQKEERLKLDSEQRDVFKEVAGKNAMEILGPIVNSDDWKQIPDFAKAEVYRKVIEGTRKQGQYAALPPDGEARAKLREQIVNKIIKQTQEADTSSRRPATTP